jgi:hypothetical protein
MLVANLKRDDYVNIVCGSLDQLPETFARLDQEKQAKRLMGIPPAGDEVGAVLQITTASLSTPDRNVVRNKGMGLRMRAAADSRAPRFQI